MALNSRSSRDQSLEKRASTQSDPDDPANKRCEPEWGEEEDLRSGLAFRSNSSQEEINDNIRIHEPYNRH